jgi:hypothetical protein
VPTQYAQDQAFEQAVEHASGVSGPQPGMPAYPLYGVPPLGQTQEAPVPFYRAPLFVGVVSGAAGFGLGYLVFGKLLPKLKKNWAEEKDGK